MLFTSSKFLRCFRMFMFTFQIYNSHKKWSLYFFEDEQINKFVSVRSLPIQIMCYGAIVSENNNKKKLFIYINLRVFF